MHTSITNYNNLTKPYAHYRKFAVSVGVFFLSFFIAGTFSPVLPSSALTCTDGSVIDPSSTSASVGDVCNTSGTSVTVNIENPAYLTISSSAGGSGGISLDYTKEGSPNLGNLITASDTVTTTSNTGQTKHLYISTSSSSNNLTNNDTDLDNNKTYIKAGGSDTLAGATALSDNTWGFSLENDTNFTKVPTLGNELLIQEGTGDFDDETDDYVSTQDIYYGAIATSDLYAGEYTNTIKYTAFTDEPVVTTHYMQDFTIEDCNNLKTSTTTEDHRITLIDRRDNKPYKVSRLADGNCWMVENLALDPGILLTSANSNVGTDWFFSEDYLLTSSAATPSTASSPQVSIGYQKSTDNGNLYGNYYNYMAATAGEGNENFSGVATQSICPKKWQLPDSTGSKSYSFLFEKSSLPSSNVYGDDAVVAIAKIRQAPFSFPLAGRWYNGIGARGTYGYYWERRTSSTTNAYHLDFNTSRSYFGPKSTYSKAYARSVRCVFGE